MLPVAILCGGEGTRANLPLNKCFVDVAGKPFLLHQLEWLETQGCYTTVLCKAPYGTLYALRDAVRFLGERFIVLYGDTLLRIDLERFIAEWAASDAVGATVFYEGTDAGVSGCSAWALGDAPVHLTNFDELRDHFLSLGNWMRYRTDTRWLEVGTPEALREARRILG